MSVKWNLSAELRRGEAVDDERMQQKKTQNMDLLWQAFLPSAA